MRSRWKFIDLLKFEVVNSHVSYRTISKMSHVFFTNVCTELLWRTKNKLSFEWMFIGNINTFRWQLLGFFAIFEQHLDHSSEQLRRAESDRPSSNYTREIWKPGFHSEIAANVFPRATLGKFKKATITGPFAFAVEENSDRAPFSRCLPSPGKRKARVFKFLPF